HVHRRHGLRQRPARLPVLRLRPHGGALGVRRRVLRRLAAMAAAPFPRLLALGAAIAVAGCGASAPEDPTPEDPIAGYLTDPAFRRAELVASLVNPTDGYAQLRLHDYGEAWEQLPVWNPRVAPITAGNLAAGLAPPLGPDAHALAIDDAAQAGDPAALTRLGQAAFSAYPVQLLEDAAPALASLDAAAAYGFAVDPATGQVGGLVRAEMADGSSRVAVTCATCHASLHDGALTRGIPNAALDLGK